MGSRPPPRPCKMPPPPPRFPAGFCAPEELFESYDRVRAMGFGVDLTDPYVDEAMRAMKADSDMVLDIAEKWRRRAERWRVRWCWTFGTLMCLIVIGIILIAVLKWKI